jgi:glucose/arabinose dehydrogenase
MLAVGPDGQLYVTERGVGSVVRLPDRDGDGVSDGREVVAGDMEYPSGLAFHPDGSLYVADVGSVVRFSNPDAQGRFTEREIVIPDIPADGHKSRTLAFSPDGSQLYLSIGSTCNVCEEEDPRRAAILLFNSDGSGETLFAKGLRNAVGITLRPSTEELWATNNGTDMMGDDVPPEMVIHAQAGDDFGWPRCHAGRIPDPKFGGRGACNGVAQPLVEIQAHSAPLGLGFYTGEMFPEEYRGDLFVALHGSWNRTEPTGYKVVRIPMQDGVPGPVEDFAVGWLAADGSSFGRPVDVVTGTDGALYVSDDAGGRIYRIDYP